MCHIHFISFLQYHMIRKHEERTGSTPCATQLTALEERAVRLMPQAVLKGSFLNKNSRCSVLSLEPYGNVWK